MSYRINKDSEMLRKLREYFDTTPREQVLKDWADACKATEGIISPTVDEFLGWQRNPVCIVVRPIKIPLQIIRSVNILFSAENYNENINFAEGC